MPSQSILNLALFASTVFAAPSYRGFLVPRQSVCGPESNGQLYIADIGFYSDKDCTENISASCVYTEKGIADGGPGGYGCNPSSLPDTTPFWGKVVDSPYDQMQILFT